MLGPLPLNAHSNAFTKDMHTEQTGTAFYDEDRCSKAKHEKPSAETAGERGEEWTETPQLWDQMRDVKSLETYLMQ